jgi:hypothetical protein
LAQLAIDETTGVLTAQAGLTLEAVIVFRQGWFPAVVPGTRLLLEAASPRHSWQNHHRDGTLALM